MARLANRVEKAIPCEQIPELFLCPSLAFRSNGAFGDERGVSSSRESKEDAFLGKRKRLGPSVVLQESKAFVGVEFPARKPLKVLRQGESIGKGGSSRLDPTAFLEDAADLSGLWARDL